MKPNITGMKNLIGRPQKPFGLKDSDKDGVMNMVDCKPFNKNKQGILHDIKERIRENAEARRERGKEVRAARFEARKTQEVRAAKEIEKVRAERKIKRAKTGGYFGEISRAYATRPKIRPAKLRPVRRTKKKKKTRARRISTPRRQQSLGEYLRTNL